MKAEGKQNLISFLSFIAAVSIMFTAMFTMPERFLSAYADEDGEDVYYVTVNVTDQNGSAIEDPDILFERLHSSYSSALTQKIEPENGKYRVDCGEGFAICYLEVSASGYEKKTLNLDPRSSAGKNNEVAITVTLNKAKDPNMERNLRFKVVDSTGNEIPGASLILERNKKGYEYDQLEPVSGMDYTVKETYDEGTYYWQYRFRASAGGYQSVTGEDFSFKSAYYNQYFDPATSDDPIVVRIRLKSNEEVLDEAKRSAVSQLNSYKDRNSYRSEEQQEYDRIISEGTGEIENASSIAAVNAALSAAKRKLDGLKTAAEYENEELRANIFFRAGDGRMVEPDQDGVITLTDADSGTFYFRKEGGGTYTNNASATYWKCEVKVTSGSSISWNYIIGAYGQYQPRVTGGPFDATVKVRDLNKTVSFKVKVVKEKIDQIRAFVGGRDVSGETIHVLGSEEKRAVIKAHIKDTEKWITLPINAVEFTAGGAVSVDHSNGVFRVWGVYGKMTYSLTTDPSIKVSFNIISDPVSVSGIDVYVPPVNYIDYWDTMSGNYTGVLEGDPDEKDRYHVTVSPSNATNPAVVWEALTPEIATQSDIHSAGIVPKKAGKAEFIVRSVENPSVYKRVTVVFKYRNPLYTAVPDQDTYYMKKGESRTINIITNGKKNRRDGASEQRFRWSYSDASVASIKDKVVSDVTLSGAKECTHTVTALKEGVVFVTGYPYDDSEGCAPVTFKIIVTKNADKDREAVEKVEKMINDIGEVTLEKESLIKAARKAFNSLTTAQKGMVADGIYQKLVDAELLLKKLKRQKDKESDKQSGDKGDGNGKSSGEKGGSGATDSTDGNGRSGGPAGDPATPGNTGNGNDGVTDTDASENDGEAMPMADTIQDVQADQEGDRRAKNPDSSVENGEYGSRTKPDLIEAREVDVDELYEKEKEQDVSVRINGTYLMIMALLGLLAFLFGGQKKYKEYRSETIQEQIGNDRYSY